MFGLVIFRQSVDKYMLTLFPRDSCPLFSWPCFPQLFEPRPRLSASCPFTSSPQHRSPPAACLLARLTLSRRFSEMFSFLFFFSTDQIFSLGSFVSCPFLRSEERHNPNAASRKKKKSCSDLLDLVSKRQASTLTELVFFFFFFFSLRRFHDLLV